MVSPRSLKNLHIFFGIVALTAGVINALSNPFYPCALTLIPASLLYFMGAVQNMDLLERFTPQVLLLTVGFGITYAGIWELLILTSWNDLLHIFMALTGIYFFSLIKRSENVLNFGLLGGIMFMTFIRIAYKIRLFELTLNLKIPILQEFGSMLLAALLTFIISGILIFKKES